MTPPTQFEGNRPPDYSRSYNRSERHNIAGDSKSRRTIEQEKKMRRKKQLKYGVIALTFVSAAFIVAVLISQ